MPAETWEAIERLGGWGIVVLVMWWLMSRSDKRAETRDEQITALVAALRESLSYFARFEQEEKETHLKIVSHLEQQTATLRDIQAEMKAVRDKLAGRS